MTTNRERAWSAIVNSDARYEAGVGHIHHEGLVREITTELNAAEARGRAQALEWRPIETASKDGSPVLMAVPAAGKWSICFGWIGDGSHPSRCATHWMPLPAGPQGDGDE